MPSIATSVEMVPRSRIRELAEIAMTMDGVLRLYFGESNLPTPEYIKQAANRALADGYTFYTENAGLPTLRRALADNYCRLHGVSLDPATEIVVTASGVQALNLGIRCVLNPGDEAIVLTPAWPNGSSSVMMANATVRQVPQPLVRGPLHRRFRRPRSGRHAAHPPAALHVAVESARLGRHRRGAAGPARFRPPPRSLADGRRSLRPPVLRRRSAGRARPFHPAQGHARRRRDGGALLLQDLLHDRVARRLAGGAPRPGGEGDPVERIHHFARAHLRPEGRRDRAGRGRRRTAAHAGAS